MRFSPLPALVLLTGVYAFAGAGCSKPEPPVLTPKSAKVVAVSLAGVDLALDVDAFNPNASELSARSVTGKVVLDGRYTLGAATMSTPIRLPAGVHTDLTVPLAATWTDLTALATLAATNRPVPFTVDGTVNVGGDRLNVDLPLHMAGSLTHDELVKAASRSLDALPGLKLPM